MVKTASHARVARRPVHGVVLLDKPLGLSSNQALQKVKWLLRALKAGHTGTLDPLATGVLPLCFGAATKFAQIHLDADKRYQAVMRLGVTTTTGDSEGEVVRQLGVRMSSDELMQKLACVLPSFKGEVTQLPPMFSALKHEGKALYEYARAGIEVERKTRQVVIHGLEVTVLDHETVEIDVTCSKGTYIRTLACDIGDALGCGAHLIGLRRVATGAVSLDQCITIEALENMTEAERLKCLKPPECLLEGIPQVVLEECDAGRFLTGMRRVVSLPDAALVKVVGRQPDVLLGIGHIKAGELIPDRLLSPVEIQQWIEQKYNCEIGEMNE